MKTDGKQLKTPAKVAFYIFRAWRKHPDTGEKLWAKDYGLHAWRIPVYA